MFIAKPHVLVYHWKVYCLHHAFWELGASEAAHVHLVSLPQAQDEFMLKMDRDPKHLKPTSCISIYYRTVSLLKF